ncbi:MAG: hypothetical protein ACOYMS_08760 [Terrimicrobiaceae bacterium]
MTTKFLSRRPWLLVWLVFILLIAGWAVTYVISQQVPSRRLTPSEEEKLLQESRR